MNRTHRLAALVALALVFVVGGTVLATRGPDASDSPTLQAQDGEETPPTAEELAHAKERLTANGLEVSDELLAELAAQYGLGGAVRIVAWSDGNADLMAEIRAKRDGDGSEGSAMGWGRIAKELGVHPGIGSVMGQGGGHGRENAPGQQDDDAGD
jgi:hypothetical protein